MSKRPDYQRWLGKAKWRLDDAAFIVLGIDPERFPKRLRVEPRSVGRRLRMNSAPPQPFWKLLHAAMDDEGRGLAVLEYSREGIRPMSALVKPAVFAHWASKSGYTIPTELSHLLAGMDERQPLVERRIERITQAADALGYDPLGIPCGGKGEIKSACCKDVELFTPSTFDAAWKVARSYEQVRMANHHKYVNPA